MEERILREAGSKAGFKNEKVINWKNWLQLYNLRSEYTDDPYAWLTNVLALKSVYSGNYGVGSIITNARGEIVALGHNLVYSPSFRSDLHAEIVTLNYLSRRLKIKRKSLKSKLLLKREYL